MKTIKERFKYPLVMGAESEMESLVSDLREAIEGKRKDCPHDSHSHCMEEDCYIYEDTGYNQAVLDIITLLDTLEGKE